MENIKEKQQAAFKKCPMFLTQLASLGVYFSQLNVDENTVHKTILNIINIYYLSFRCNVPVTRAVELVQTDKYIKKLPQI